MSKQQAQDLFLSITLVAVVIVGAVALAEFGDYEQYRDDHRQSQHKGGLMRAELFHFDQVSRDLKEDGVWAYYYCSLCDTTTKQQRSPYAIPDRILCRYCDTKERNT